MNIDCNRIKPAKAKLSDFFSWQLYQWVKKYPNRLSIWEASWNSCTGIDNKKRSLYIGDKRDGQWIHARQLRNLCVHGSKIEAYAYNNSHDTNNWVDVTDQFWKEYLRIGKCAIHGDLAHEWIKNSMTERQCKYCAKIEKIEIYTVQRERWIAA